MNPKDLVTDKLVDICRPLQTIFVIGYTKTGKYTIAKELSERLNREMFVSDEFQERYREKALDQLEMEIEHCYYAGKNVIFEGILGFRLLRRLAQKGYINPDLIIKTNCSEQTIRYFYNKEEPNKNINRVLGFNNGLDKVWNDYIEIVSLQQNKPKFLTLNTSVI